MNGIGIELVGVSGGFGCAIETCVEGPGETEEAAEPGSLVCRLSMWNESIAADSKTCPSGIERRSWSIVPPSAD